MKSVTCDNGLMNTPVFPTLNDDIKKERTCRNNISLENLNSRSDKK